MVLLPSVKINFYRISRLRNVSNSNVNSKSRYERCMRNVLRNRPSRLQHNDDKSKQNLILSGDKIGDYRLRTSTFTVTPEESNIEPQSDYTFSNHCAINYLSDQPEKIISAKTLTNGRIMFLVKWNTNTRHDCFSFVYSEEAKEKFPQVLIKFYQDHLIFC